jgi:hypothetical protein
VSGSRMGVPHPDGSAAPVMPPVGAGSGFRAGVPVRVAGDTLPTAVGVAGGGGGRASSARTFPGSARSSSRTPGGSRAPGPGRRSCASKDVPPAGTLTCSRSPSECGPARCLDEGSAGRGSGRTGDVSAAVGGDLARCRRPASESWRGLDRARSFARRRDRPGGRRRSTVGRRAGAATAGRVEPAPARASVPVAAASQTPSRPATPHAPIGMRRCRPQATRPGRGAGREVSGTRDPRGAAPDSGLSDRTSPRRAPSTRTPPCRSRCR